MPTSTFDAARLRTRAKAEGFSAVRITDAHLPELAGQRFRDAAAQGYTADMDWLTSASHRASPDLMWPEARSAIVLSMNYGQGLDPLARLDQTSTGVISTYALNRDYHDIIKGKLKTVAQWVAHNTGAAVKVFVDTAPLMEKPLAQQAGLGWQGKHSNLVSREQGSWFLLGVILSAAALPVDAPETDYCGTCQACLDICPTRAFPKPYVLDARRCISYLTIEHAGHIPREFREAMGNRIYGCDDCLAVCPWNKFAQQAEEAKLQAREDLIAPALADLLALNDAAFRRIFSASPVKRTGRDRFVRNCLIAAGNSGDPLLVPPVRALLSDASPLVRAMAVWALRRLMGAEALALRTLDQDDDMQAEWLAA
jgi:epoxyqueuosine reductase